MKASFRWLQALAPGLTATPEEVSERLASRGCPVEEVHPLGEGLAELRVARVRSVASHPNADRLRVCEVEDGTGVVQVVCGASNVVAGGWYPFAPVGAALPGGMRIGKAKLRGVVSEGMLCSERELGMGSSHEGLMTLMGDFEVGQPLVAALGLDDLRLDVEVTSNRPDLLSHEGIARELAPGGHVGLVLPPIPGEDPAVAMQVEALELRTDSREVESDGVAVRIDAPELCSRYLGLVVRGVRVGPSPAWLQTRLRAAGARPINNVVDATNYVLLELGQPLHAFDLAFLEGGRIVVRRAGEGESLRTLDGVERPLASEMLAICDARRPVAVAGVMGGEESEVREGTSDILLECALFTPGPIRATRKALGLSTDASYRFERGVDPEGLVRALRRTARLILATAGGRVEGAILDCSPRPFRRERVTLRPERVERFLGVDFHPEAIEALLVPLGFEVRAEGSALQVEVPGFRSYDVRREVDLIEEIARTHGYDRFPETLAPFRPSTVPDHPLFGLEGRVRDTLGSAGLLEAQTPAFAPRGEGEVELQNPISAEEGVLRSRLLPGLFRRLEHNLARGNRDVRLYEIGTVFAASAPGELPTEETRIAFILHGAQSPPHWSGPARGIDLWDLKGLLERLARLLPGEGWSVVPGGEEEGLDPDAAFTLVDASGARVGGGGRILPGRVDLPPWAGELWGAEATLPPEPLPLPVSTFEPLPAHPGVERDLALLLPGGVGVREVLALVRARGDQRLKEISVFDVYRDARMATGSRSVAIRLRFRAADRTLTDAEVDEALQGITRALEEELRVGIRGAGA